ncbi:MAG: replication and repair protein RadC [Acidobacteria bacterium]|jgi:DNA repair protein RadC|nr:replication and repair protein RadC [Acidobacteriota bacterium]
MNSGSEILDLLSHVLSHGNGSESARRASGRLLSYFGSVQDLAHATLEEIRRAGKISEQQAEFVFCALELGKQVCSIPLKPGERFSNSRELFQRYRARFFAAQKEHFFSLHLNSKNQLIREVLISIGSLSTSVVHPREVFAPAVRDSSAALIFLHNHPSGDPAPSREDKECTQRLIHAGQILGIRVLDHIVMGHSDYFSFADAGLLNDTLSGILPL